MIKPEEVEEGDLFIACTDPDVAPWYFTKINDEWWCGPIDTPNHMPQRCNNWYSLVFIDPTHLVFARLNGELTKENYDLFLGMHAKYGSKRAILSS